MENDLVLASGSEIRARMLRSAGLRIEVDSPRVDEEAIKQALLVEQATPHDIADTLAETKAGKVAAKRPNARVLAADQVLALGSELFSKPATPDEALHQLRALRGQTHMLLSAAVLFEDLCSKDDYFNHGFVC